MGCRRMLGAWDRAAIMAGVNAGLSQTRIAHLIGRSPSVVCCEIARHTGPDGQYRAEEGDKAARAARRHPKKRLFDCDEVLRRVIADWSQGHTPRQISAPLARAGVWHSGSYGQFSPRPGPHDQPRGDLHVDLRPQEDAHRARHLPAIAQVDAQETPGGRAQTTHRWDAAD